MDLKNIQENYDKRRLLTRYISFQPFVDAVKSHIYSFFKNNPATEVVRVIEVTKGWWGEEEPIFENYRTELINKAETFMRLGKQHPEGMGFVVKHLLDYVRLWPATKLSSSEQTKLNQASKKFASKKRNLMKKKFC